MSNGSQYGSSRPTSVCSNHSNPDNNYNSNGNYHNGAVLCPPQQFNQPKSNGYGEFRVFFFFFFLFFFALFLMRLRQIGPYYKFLNKYHV